MASGVAQALVARGATVPTGRRERRHRSRDRRLPVPVSARARAHDGGPTAAVPFWLPAWLVAGVWGLTQFLATWQSVLAPTALEGGVAYMAHFAGFALGLATISVFADRRNPEYQRLYGR